MLKAYYSGVKNKNKNHLNRNYEFYIYIVYLKTYNKLKLIFDVIHQPKFIKNVNQSDINFFLNKIEVEI